MRGDLALRRLAQRHDVVRQRQRAARGDVEQARRLRHLDLGQRLSGPEAPAARAQRQRLDCLALAVDEHVALVDPDQRRALRVEAGCFRVGRADGPGALGVDIAPQVVLAHRGQPVLERRGLLERGRDGHAALLVDIAPAAGLIFLAAGHDGGQPFVEGLRARRVGIDLVGAALAFALPVGHGVGGPAAPRAASAAASASGRKNGARVMPPRAGERACAPPGCCLAGPAAWYVCRK